MSSDRPDFMVRARSFHHGFLSEPDDDMLPFGSSPDAANWIFGRVDNGRGSGSARASMLKRTGERAISTSAIVASTRADGLFDFRRTNQTSILVCVINGKIYEFDNVDAWSQVAATAPFTAGEICTGLIHRDWLYLMDGTAQKRTDGTTIEDIGLETPTGTVAMTTSATGVTGTYDSVYTWYDSATDHDSSPSDITTAVVFANQARNHTKPTSTAPGTATHWRAWVRRTDTFEVNFFLVGSTAVATGTLAESVADTARTDLAPLPNANDEPPANMTQMVYHLGYGIALVKNDEHYYTSAQGNLQAWHPKHKWPVERGGGEPICAVCTLGTLALVMKPHRSWFLSRDRVPFKLDRAHPGFGCVGPEAWKEANDRLYAWDRVRGPYRTDGLVWEPLADNRIRPTIDAVNRTVDNDIRCFHVEKYNLVGWAFATTSTRKRTIVPYNYVLDAWCPPMTGLEYGAFSTFTETASAPAVYMVDEWGMSYEMFSGDSGGVDISTTIKGLVDASSGGGNVSVQGGGLDTAGSGLVGRQVAVMHQTDETWQWRRIQSNTATDITLDTTDSAAWTIDPTNGDTIVIGGIDWYSKLSWWDFGMPEQQKKLWHLFLQGYGGQSDVVTVDVLLDDRQRTEAQEPSFELASRASTLWGVMVWGVSLWGTAGRSILKHSIERACLSVQVKLSNPYCNQPHEITMVGISADRLGRKAPSG